MSEADDIARGPSLPGRFTSQGIIGRWRTEGIVVGHGNIPIIGTDEYELFAGGNFIIHHVDVMVGDRHVRAIEVIGERVDGADFLARGFDADGSTGLMWVTMESDTVWRFSGGSEVAQAAREGDAPSGGLVRATLRIAANSMVAAWERADDGSTWTPWMDVRFSRLD